MTGSRAAVDVGTNSIRLLVVDAEGKRRTRQLTITRLGQGVDRTGNLDDEALARTLLTIERYRDIWTEHGAEGRVRIAATSAVRDAADRDRFFDGVRERTGVEVESLTGAEEAAATFLGASRAVETLSPTVVLDVGGGSTEIVLGPADASSEPTSASLQLGCVRLTERVLTDDPPTGDQIERANRLIADHLDEADRAFESAGGATLEAAATLVGVAGTATTLGALHLGLEAYDEDAIHGTRIPASRVEGWALRLTTMRSAERAELGPMQRGREDVIAAGAMIVAAVVTRYGFRELVVSEADILDGLVAGPA